MFLYLAALILLEKCKFYGDAEGVPFGAKGKIGGINVPNDPNLKLSEDKILF